MLARTKRIAVLGIKTVEQRDQPAYHVPEYLVHAGFDVIPVPVYYPEVTEILGRPVYRSLVEIPGDIDLVNVFRRRADLKAHTADILAKRPKVVWLQTGIRHEGFAEELTKAGIEVVQSQCIMVEHKRCVGG